MRERVTGSVQELTGSSETTFVVVEDPKVGEHTHEERAQLRSLPLLHHLGFTQFLHRPMWENGFKMVEYQHLDPNELESECVTFPIVHTVSERGLQETPVDDNGVERRGEQHLMQKLLRQRTSDDPYIVVTDTNAPWAPAISTQRPITDEYGPVTTVDYESFVDDYVARNLDSALPMSDTRNFFFHEASGHHREHGAPSDSLLALFDYDRAPPDSPVWKPLYYFVEHDLEAVLDRYTERIRETLRSWLERGDVTKIANQMDAMLTRCEFRADKLDEQRKSNEQ
jgi:hypothetical protein